MTFADVLCLAIACAALGILAWESVNSRRTYGAMLRANAEITERSAEYQRVMDNNVDRRIAIVNETLRKAQEPLRPTPPKVTNDAPELNGRPHRISEATEKQYEDLSEAPEDPDSLRREDMVGIE